MHTAGPPASLAILSQYLHHTLEAEERDVDIPTEGGFNPGLLVVLRAEA